MADRPTTLYRLYDWVDDLLYVGISESAMTRFSQHLIGKEWWTDVALIRLQHFETRAEAVAAETEAIRSECPRHNIRHNSFASLDQAIRVIHAERPSDLYPPIPKTELLEAYEMQEKRAGHA